MRPSFCDDTSLSTVSLWGIPTSRLLVTRDGSYVCTYVVNKFHVRQMDRMYTCAMYCHIMHIYIYVYMYACMYVCVCMHACMYVCVHMYTCMYICVYIRILCMYVFMRVIYV